LDVIAPIEESAGKANVLFQTYISQGKLTGFTVISDTNYVAQNAGRVGRALFEVCLRKVRLIMKYRFFYFIPTAKITGCDVAGMVFSGNDLSQAVSVSGTSSVVVPFSSETIWWPEL